jgi:hypothetical protein
MKSIQLQRLWFVDEQATAYINQNMVLELIFANNNERVAYPSPGSSFLLLRTTAHVSGSHNLIRASHEESVNPKEQRDTKTSERK